MNSNGHFSIHVFNDPNQHTSTDDVVIGWFFRHYAAPMIENGGADSLLQMPYHQGGQIWILFKVGNLPSEAPKWVAEIEQLYIRHAQADEDREMVSEDAGELSFTGWVLVNNYTDSMTSMYHSAVFQLVNPTANWQMGWGDFAIRDM